MIHEENLISFSLELAKTIFMKLKRKLCRETFKKLKILELY
jgi:hypothetical protein